HVAGGIVVGGLVDAGHGYASSDGVSQWAAPYRRARHSAILRRTEFKTISVRRTKPFGTAYLPALPEFTAFIKRAFTTLHPGLTPQIYNVLNWRGALSHGPNSDAPSGLGEI